MQNVTDLPDRSVYKIWRRFSQLIKSVQRKPCGHIKYDFFRSDLNLLIYAQIFLISTFSRGEIWFEGIAMWHSQILGSFEAKNITCVFLHENSNLAIEITKDVFPDVKKCKKVRKSGLKRLFCIFQPYGRGEFDQFSPPMCATRRVFQPCG